MNETDKQGIVARFLQAGIFDLQSRLGVPAMRDQAGSIFSATFFTPAGKTSFELNMDLQVDLHTQNLEGYLVRHQPAIVIADITASGINSTELETRIKALDYIADLDSKQMAAAKLPIQADLDLLGFDTKPASQSVYLAFLAKYYQAFNFGDTVTVLQKRKQKLDNLFREKYFSLTGKNKVLPPAAYDEITGVSFRMVRKNITTAVSSKDEDG